VIAWTLFSGDSRKAFHDRVGQDAATWARARGWALWKALITLAWDADINEQARSATVIDDVVTGRSTEGGAVSRPRRA